ncbi:MAG: hypothetical protein COB36_09140 [Alphaproteobacteria bacterium]|nr:MAG: hypothetical protein COB36_09140 [Alphaproteobacteria bacterium]
MIKYLILILILSIIGAFIALILFMMFLFGLVGVYENYVHFLIAYGVFQGLALSCLMFLGIGIWRRNRGDEKEQYYQKNIHK